MATEYVLGVDGEGVKVTVGHPHCGCGACLQYVGQPHPCPGFKPIDPEVLEVIKDETKPNDAKAAAQRRAHYASAEGFQVSRRP